MKKPNILFFFTDDQRFNTIRAFGNNHIQTPNLDDLVANGTTFTNAYIMGGTSGAVCMPSRAMMLTGRTLFHIERQGQRIPEEHVTLPEALREHGYTTLHVGKWHQDRDSFRRCFHNAARVFGFCKGWYETYGGHWNVPLHDFDPTGEYNPEDGYMLDADKVTRRSIGTGNGGVHSSELFADAAIQFLQDYRDEKPFFLYLSFVAPHDPRQSPDMFENMYPDSEMPLPPNYMPRHPFDNGDLWIRDEKLEGWPRRKRAVQRHLAAYYGMISHADAQIGRVMDALRESGHSENTIIVFSGGNGLAVGQHGLMGKQSVYEHSVHVPLILSGPGVPSGEKSEGFCYLLDIFPTLCELTEIPTPKSVEGRSLVPCIQNNQASVREDLFFGYKEYQRSIRDYRHKLIEYSVNGEHTTQLFDLVDDPWETLNLADQSASETQKLLREFRFRLLKRMQELDDPALGTFSALQNV